MGRRTMSPEQLDALVTRIASLSRREAIDELESLRCTFRLDFTRAYLDGLSIDRLRHILMAAHLHAAPRREESHAR